jgi:hypothetical protein
MNMQEGQRKENLKELIERAISEHPKTFPSSSNIVALLKDYGLQTDSDAVLKKVRLAPFQIKWLDYVDDSLFMKNFSVLGANQSGEEYRELVRKRLETIIKKVLKKDPNVVPSSPQISDLLEKQGWELDSQTLRNNLDLVSIQVEWIASCDRSIFLENYSNQMFNNLNERCRQAAKERFGSIVENELGKHKDVFPGSVQIADLLGISTATVSTNLDLTSIQIKWIESCDEKIFIDNFIRKVFNPLGEDCKEAARNRFAKIIERAIANNLNVLPSSYQITSLLGKSGIKTNATTVRNNFDVVSAQVKWINSCEVSLFLENFKAGRFKEPTCIEAAKKRFKRIVEKELQINPKIFPTSNQISVLLEKKYGVKVSHTSVLRNIDLVALQSKWIESSDEKILLESISSGVITNIDKKCREALDRRMHSILLSHLDNLDKLPMHKETLKRYLKKKFPDLAFLLTTMQEQRFTMDQRIVLSMHLWIKTRKAELHEKIGERLDQLWGFRELYALSRDGRCLDAHVISMFHESLPQRVSDFIPQSSITHFFVDDLFGGDFKAEPGKEILLLSFMHWFTERQAATALSMLNAAVSTDNPIFVTNPDIIEYSSDVLLVLENFGFTAERIGTLYLLPPSMGDVGEQRKLLTKSKILQIRKAKDAINAPEEANLFSKVRRRPGRERIQPNTEIVSYDEETLRNAIPLLTMKDISSIITEEIPHVKGILIGEDETILELKGGAVVGFNMDPRHPYSIEIEGKRVPRGTDNAIIDVLKGRAGFNVSKGMKADYDKFLKTVQERREKISGVKRTLLR